jgi:hypothetical protein
MSNKRKKTSDIQALDSSPGLKPWREKRISQRYKKSKGLKPWTQALDSSPGFEPWAQTKA